MEDFITALLTEIGEDVSREGLQKTPGRWQGMMKELTSGYSQSLEKIVNGALFDAESHDMVIVRSIDLYSLCEHHILPFFGKAHIAYLPGRKIIGFSKIPRIVDMFARRLQTQERIGGQICNALEKVLKPKGIGIVIEAAHMCMKMRGVEKDNANVRTHHFRGDFCKDTTLQEEFLQAIANI